MRIVFNEDCLSHPRLLLQKLNALNVYQLNIYQHPNFMYKLRNDETPAILHNIIKILNINILQISPKPNLVLENVL